VARSNQILNGQITLYEPEAMSEAILQL